MLHACAVPGARNAEVDKCDGRATTDALKLRERMNHHGGQTALAKELRDGFSPGDVIVYDQDRPDPSNSRKQCEELTPQT